MKKLTFDQIGIELTRKCNMNPPCWHCFRGNSENVSLDNTIIDNFLSQTEIIGSLFFTGGEPLICIDKMKYFIDKLYELEIPLFEFGFITNGLIFNDEAVNIIKDYSNMVKLCREMGEDNNIIDIEKYVIIGISIDNYHNQNEIAETNLIKYKNELKGYAQVVRVADGNIPRKEGRGNNLNDGLLETGIDIARQKRIEILDKETKPLCPQYQTYKLIHPDQTIVCCDMYLSALGNLLFGSIGFHDYQTVDNYKYRICNLQNKNVSIINSIKHYNQNKTDCLSLMDKQIKQNQNIHDILFYMLHSQDNNSDKIKKDLPNGYIKQRILGEMVTDDPETINDLKRLALKRDYTK